MHYVYVITCLLNGKQYVGETGNPTSRMKGHFFPPPSRKERLQVIQKAIKKHGHDNFIFEVVSSHDTVEEAFTAENSLILKKKSEGILLYNMNDGGVGGINPSPETREKMSKARLGIKLSDSTKNLIREKAKNQMNDPERRAQQRKIAKDWWENLPEEEKEIRIKELKAGQKKRIYTPLSEERKRQISDTLKSRADELGRAKDNVVELVHNCPTCGKEVKRKGVKGWKSQIKSGLCRSCRNKAGHLTRKLKAALCDSSHDQIHVPSEI